jgi:hypothetical protein
MAGRRSLVDAGGKRAHLGDLVGHLLAHQVAAEADLATLADEELAAVGEAQMVRVEAVTGLDALIEPLGRIAPLVGDHAALARAGGGARHGGAPRQRRLGLVAERAEAHARDVDGNVEHDRLFRPRADDGLGLALLAVAFDDEARQRARQERQVVPVRDLLEQREAPHAVTPELRLDVNVVDHLGGEDPTLAQRAGVALWRLRCRRNLGGCFTLRHGSTLLLGVQPQSTSFFSVGSRLS